ncbi:MAG: protoglobin domain-containing protein [Bacteroidota bacterium]|nr:protoglobin domain-containing protein [Bacteroidota bacterium]
MMKLTDKFGIDYAEQRQRLDFLKITDADINLLRSLEPLIKKHIDSIIEEFYAELLKYREAKKFFTDDAIIKHVQAAQKSYLLDIFKAEFDENYFERRLQIGAVHDKIGLPIKWYIGSHFKYFNKIITVIAKHAGLDRETEMEAIVSVIKVMNLDEQLAMENYTSLSYRIKAAEKRIQETIQGLSDLNLSRE